MGQPLSPAGRSHPFALSDASYTVKFFAVLFGTALLAAASWISVPMFPVPITMQSFAVVLVGALGGWALGGVTVLAWLAEGALGLPVLASGTGGLPHFMGPTAGYLLAFPVMAMISGYAAERGLFTKGIVLPFFAMATVQGLCLVLGAAWLAVLLGDVSRAFAAGVVPFVVGGLLKAALVVAAVKVTGADLKRQA
ncbi:biotin transport system substrate-specific component [Arboricoccus pini]|uniref:Biotin transporter n=1 Tax=Arboricoccus pini TaxID=1963835 RepID=A0A212QQ27_9PROT|nr:biotin transporter BioY [Arboricoccus pini]SNB61570.1 biotin transport system substrate-specific component [Arboricoccus pini]